MVLGSRRGESPHKCERCAKVPLFGLSFVSANWNSTMLADHSQSCFRRTPPGLGLAGASPDGAHRGEPSRGTGSASPGQPGTKISAGLLAWVTQSPPCLGARWGCRAHHSSAAPNPRWDEESPQSQSVLLKQTPR